MSEQKHDITILSEAPFLIRLAREMTQYLPRGTERDNLVRQLLKVKKELIDLDVFLQDLEWSILQKQLDSEIDNDESFKKLYPQGDD